MKRNRLGSWIHFIAPRSLRFQLLSRSLFILATLLLLVGALQYVLMKDFLYKNQAETMKVQIGGLPRDLLERSGLLPAPQVDNNTFAGHPRGPLVFLPDTSLGYISPEGSFNDLTQDNGMSSPQLTKEEYTSIQKQVENRQMVGYRLVRDQTGTEQLIVFRHAEGSGKGGIIQMGRSTVSLQNVLLRQLLVYSVLFILALSGGLALYIPVLRQTLNPLDKMVKAVERTNVGNLDEQFPDLQGQLEIDRLANSFNGMLERIHISFEAEREAKEQMRRFIADASHELRTPLTSIHGFLEVLLRGAADKPEQLHASLNSMLGESTRIKKLVEDLLMLAKLDRAPQLNLKEIRLDTLILEMEPQLRMLAGTRKIGFDLSANVNGIYDPDKIKQIILNLFQNAVQHTDPENGAITVSLTKDRKHIALKLKDNGPGIPEEHLPHVFERFYRSDSSRTRKYGGAGLGLAITQSLVEAHGGTINVQSKTGEGCTFEVLLPAV
jgi:two-component system OmpR family sensor kinase